MENIINEILKSMGKIYFRDVSRRLLLFALLLLGVVTQAMAVDWYVIVFKDLPHGTTEIPYGTSADVIKSDFFTVYESNATEVGDFAAFVDGGFSQLKNSSFEDAKGKLKLSNTTSTDFSLVQPTGNVVSAVDVKIKAYSFGITKRYILRLGVDGKVTSFKDFYDFPNQTTTQTAGSISSVTKNIDLPLYTFSVTDGNATVATLKNDILAKLSASIGDISGLTASDVTLHSGTGDVSSTTLIAGTYTYKFKLSTPAGIKASFARADGVAAPTSVEPGQTNAEVEVSGSIVVTDKTVVTLKVPAKEMLSFYEKESNANVATLGDFIAAEIEKTIPSAHSTNITVSNVRILKAGSVQSGDLVAADYSYLFDVTVNSEGYVVNIERSNSESLGATITPFRIEATGKESVKVGNSIVIKSVLSGSVFSANYTTVSNQIQNEDALKQAILSGLSKKNQALKDDIYFENIQITGTPAYPLGAGTYSYTFDVRARKDLKIAFPESSTAEIKEIKLNEKSAFTVSDKITVKKVDQSAASISFGSWSSYTYGTPLSGIESQITFTKVNGITGIEDCSVYFVKDGKETLYETGKTVLPVGKYNVKVYFPASASEIYDYSSVNVTGGTKKVETDGRASFTSTGVLTITPKAIGKTKLPVFTEGGDGLLAEGTAVNRVIAAIRAAIQSADGTAAILAKNGIELYSDETFTQKLTKGVLESGKTYSYRVILNENYKPGTQTEASVSGKLSANTSINGYDLKNAVTATKEEIKVVLPDFISTPIKIGTITTKAELEKKVLDAVNNANSGLETVYSFTPQVTTEAPLTSEGYLSYTITLKEGATHKLADYKITYQTQSSASNKLKVAADGVTCTFNEAIRFVTVLPVEHAFTSPKNIPVDYVKDMKPAAITSLVSDKLYQLNGGVLALTDKIQVTLLDKTGTAVKTVSESEAVYGYKVRVAKKSGVLEELYAGKVDADVTIDNSDATYIYVTVKNGIQLNARPVAEFNFPTYEFDYIVGETDEVSQILELIKRDLVYNNPSVLLASYIEEITSSDLSVPEGGTMQYQVKFKSDLFVDYSKVTVNGEEVAETYPLSPQIAVTINPRADLTVNLKTYKFKKEGASDELMAQHIMADILLNNPDLKGKCILRVAIEGDGYRVYFAPTTKYRTITVKGADGTTLRTVNSAKAATGFQLLYATSITLLDNGGITLIEIPMDIETELTYLNENFGYTAGHYARLILDFLNKHVTSTVANFVKPDLETWGVKVNIIRNQTQVDAGGTAELIPEDEYLKVSDLYGYQVVLTNPYFKNYYTLTLKPLANMKVTEEVPGQTWNVLLSGTITKKAVTPVLPDVTIDYADANTLAVVKAKIKEAVLSDVKNAELFRLVAATGIQPGGSFSVELTADSPVPAGKYDYTLTFKPIVTENVDIASVTGGLVVKKVKLEFEFPTDITFKYEQKKKVMESKILEEFLAMNAGIFDQYADFANPGDIFTVTLKDAACTGEANDPIAAGTYGYVIKMNDAPANFTYNIEAGGKSMPSSVIVAQKSLTVKLPTYLLNTPDEIKPEDQAKAVFVYGKILSEIENQIKLTDIPALNKKLAAAEIQAVVLLGDDGAQTKNATPIAGVYDYKVILKSDNYTFKYDALGCEVETTTDGSVIVKGGLQIVEYPVTVGFSEANRSIAGTWEIKDGKPEYSLSINWISGNNGYDLLAISDEVKKTLTLERWKMYFNNDYLNWALVDTKNEIVVQDKSLNVVLNTYVQANLTSGTYSLQVVKGGTEVPRLKSAVGDFDINLNTTLATLTVTPAIVTVTPAKAAYRKVYGQSGVSSLKPKLAFATTPKLNAATLVADYDLENLFVTTDPADADVFAAYSPVGDYTIQTSAAAGVVSGAFVPVTGVVFEAGTESAIVTVSPVPMADAVQLNVSASREYGEDPVDGDVAVAVTPADDTVDQMLVDEISTILNTAEGRVDWIDWASFNKKTNAGKYEVRFTSDAIASMGGLLTNFDMGGVTIVLDSLEIRKADLTVTAEDKNRVYSVANPELTIAYEGLKNNEYQSLDDVFDGDFLPAVATDATVDSRGTWDIYFTQKPTAKNYHVTYVTGNLSIDKIKRVIVWPEDQRNLTIAVGEHVELSAAVTSADDNRLSITGLRYELTNNDRERVVLYQNENGKMVIEGKIRTLDGPVNITVYADGDETTYMDAEPVTGTVTVVAPEGEAANVNIIVSNVTSVYDGTPRAVTVKVADKDGKEVDYKVFYEGDQTASTVYPSDQNAPVDAGVYKVIVKAEVGATTFVYEAKNKMIIAPRVVEVKARSFATTYGKTVPDYSKAYDYDKSDFLGGEDFDADKMPVVRAEAYKGNAGTYKLTPYSVQDFGKNYKVSYISGELVINKAPLTIIADDKESVYGEDLAELTYQLDGLVNGETIKNLGFAPRISSTVTKGADAGTYPIVFADNHKSTNYEVAYKEGKYVVVPASQKISWNPETSYKVEQRNIPLTAVASSKLPVSYVSDNDAVAYVNQIGDNWILTLVSDGLVKVKAIQNGNTNYWGAEPVEVTFAIGNAYESVDNETIVVSDHIEVYPTVFTTNVTVTAPSAIKRVELVSYAGVLLKVFNKPESVINLSNFGSGFYLLNVTLEDGTFKSVKLIKK